MPKQFLSINEAAAKLGVSTKTLRRWEEKGILSPKRTVGNQRRYSLADLEQADKQSLTIHEAAARIGVSAKTLRRWEEKGILTPQRTSGNQRRYAVSDIEPLKNKSTKEITEKLTKKGTQTPTQVVEKARFFDLASVKVDEAPKINPVVADFSPVVTNEPCYLPIHDEKYRFSRYFTKQSAAWSGAFLSVIAVLFLINSLSHVSVSVKLLSLLPSLNHTNSMKEKKVGSSNEVLATETTKHDYRMKISVPAEFLSTASVSGKLTAPNILYGVVAGSNITISGDRQNPTISANVALNAGTGITVANGTITNTDTGSSQKIFGSIKVGSDTISAGSNTDTFELAAGNNVTLSTDTSNKKITISANSSSSNSLTVQEGDTTVSSNANTLDFLGGDFDVGESPTGEANVSLASTLTSVTGVAGNFSVGGSLTVGSDTISDFTGTNSGLQVSGGTLSLITTCADNEILKYTSGGGWACSTDAGTGAAVGGIGAQNQVAFWTNATTLSGTNNFYWDNTNERFGIGTNGAPNGKFEVNGASKGKALAILNETGDQNILTASASGVTQLNLDRSGNLAIEGAISDLSNTVLTVNDDLKVAGNDIIDSGDTTRISLGSTTTLTNSNLTLSGTSTLDATSLTAINGGATAINFSEFAVSATDGGITINDDANAGHVTVEGTRLDIDSLDFVAGGTITTAAGNDLNLNPGGNHVLFSNGTTLNVGGAAAASYNFFADSTAGATLPASDNDLYIQGDLEVDGSIRLNNQTYTFPATSGSNGYALTTNGSGTLSWADTAGFGTNYWDQITGVLTPKIETQDLLLGSQATTSAKFAFANVAGGTPTASISAITTNNTLSLDANGIIGTTNEQTLTLGTTATGNINLVIGTGNNLTMNGLAGQTLASASCVTTTNGIVTGTGSCTTPLSSFIWSTNAGAIVEGNTTQDLLIGSIATSSAKFAVLNVAGGTPVASVSAGTAGAAFLTADGTLQTTNLQSLTLGGGNTGNIMIGTAGFTSCSALETINGVLSCGVDNVGSAGTNYWQMINGAISPFSETLDVLIGSTATDSAEFAVTGIAAGTPTATLSATTNGNGLSLNASNATIQSLNQSTLTLGGSTTGNIILSGRNGSNNSIYLQGYDCSALSNGGALTVTSSGLVQCSADDSAAGGGTLNIKEGNSPIVTSATDINFAASDFTITAESATQGGVAIDYGNSGITRRNNAEVIGGQWSFLADILAGGTSTASARFAVLNMMGAGTPTATLSAGTAGGTFLTAAGTLQSTADQTLTLGGDSTGNILLSPKNGSGDVRINGTTTLNGLTYTWPGTQSPGYVLQTNGSGVLSWVDAGTLPTINYWDRLNGALYPKNAESNDLLLGSTATSSAEFSISGISAGSPTASLSATTNGNGISLTASNGTIQSLNKGTLTLGGSSTGDINFAINTGTNLRINGIAGATVTASCVTTVNGIVTGGTSCPAAAANDIWQTGNGSIFEGNTTQDLLIGSVATSSAKFAVLNVAGGTPVASVSAGTPGAAFLTADGTLATTALQTLTFGTSSTGNINLGTDNTARTINIGNTTGSTAINIDAGTGGINLGDNAAIKTIDIGGVNNSGTDTIRIATEGTAADTITIGNNNASTTLALTGGTAWSVNTTGVATFSQLNVDNLRLDVNTLSATSGDLTIDANGGDIVSTNRLTLGSLTPTTLATLDVQGLSGTLSVATVSGQTSFASLVIDNAGNGDLFTASASGRTRLALANSGELRFYDADASNYTGFKTPTNITSNAVYELPTAFPVANNYVLQSTTNGVLSWVDAGSLPSVNYWDRLNGAIYPKNAESNDLLLGSTATNSAEFSISGISAGTPTASLSATTNGNGLSLTASSGTIQSLNLATLTIGGATTGNIVLDSGSNLISLSDPTSLSSTLDVTGTTTLAGALNANGNVTLGDAITDTLTFTGRVAQDSDIIPITTTGTNDLGSASLPWDNLYVGVVTQNGATLDTTYAPINANFITVTANGTLTGETGIDALTSAISTTSTLNVDSSSTLNNVTLDPNANLILSAGTGKLGLGTSSPLAALDVRGNSGTTSIATISGNTSFAGLVIDNSGSGDIFTASTGGVSKFTVQNNGTLLSSNYTTAGGIFYGTSTGAIALSAAGNTGQILQSNGSGAPTWLATSSLNFWQRNLGALAPDQITNDLLLGSTATNSAKFAFTNVAGGTPTASISGVGNIALSLDANGIIGTTNEQTLTLGNTATGNINLVIGAGNNLTVNGLAGQTIGAATCVTTTNGIVTGTGSCTSPTSIYLWNSNSGAIIEGNTTMDLLLGSTATSSAKFAVLNIAGSLTPVATLSAGTAGGSFLTADGNLQTTNYQPLSLGGGATGDISLSAKAGSGTLALSANALTINNTPGITSVSPTCVSFTKGIVTGSGSCGAGTGGSVWTFNTTDGTLYPINSTMDLIIGGVSTASAKFAVINVAGGTPVASVSAGTPGAAFLTANGNLQTTAKQSLTLGGGNTGNVVLSGATTGIIHANASGVLSSSAVSLTSDVSGILPIANGGSPFEQNLGAITERITTQDFLLGSTATNSARFAVINIAGGTPVASLSAIAGGAFLTADGQLQTTAKQSLTLGGGATGNVVVSGLATGVVHSTNGVLSSSAVNLTGGADITGTLGVGNGGTGNTSLAAGALFYGAGGNTALNTLTIGSANTCLLSTGSAPSWGNCALGTNYWQSAAAGTISPYNSTVDLLFGETATASATFHLYGSNSLAGTQTVASVGAKTSFAGLVVDNRGNGDLFTASSSGLNRFVIKQNGNVGIGTALPAAKLDITGEANTGLDIFSVYSSDRSENLSIFSDGTHLVMGTGGQELIFDNNVYINNAADIYGLGAFSVGGISGGSLPSKATVEFQPDYTWNVGGTLPIASIAGKTSFAALAIDNSGGGDLFTASQGGIKRFVITPTGNLQFTGNTNVLTTLTSAATSAQTITLPNASGTVCLSANNCASSAIWNTNGAGAIIEGNTTMDLLLGGTATTSSKFAFTGVAGSVTPVASIAATPSSGTTNGLSLSGTGTIQSLNKNTLTIGGSTTGDIAIANQLITTSGDLILNPFDEVYLADGKNLVIGGHPGNVNYNVIANSANTSHGLNADSDLFIEGQLEVDGAVYFDNSAITLGNAAFANCTALTTTSNALGCSTTTLGSNWNAGTNGVIYPKITSQDFLLGGTSSSSALFRVTGDSKFAGTTSVASISANTSFAGMVVDNKVGDLFTASSSGLSRFVITQAGNVGIGTTLPTADLSILQKNVANPGLLVTAKNGGLFDANTFEVDDSGGSLAIGYLDESKQTWIRGGSSFYGNPALLVQATNGGAPALKVGGGAAAPIGSTAPTASISANSSFAALLVDNMGSGDLFTASSSGLPRFVIQQNGNVGIGTTPQNGYALHIVSPDQTGNMLKLERTGSNNPNTWNFQITSNSTAGLSAGSLALINGTNADFGIRTLNNNVYTAIFDNSSRSLSLPSGIGTVPTASIAGATTFAGLLVDNSGSGDLFTASSSGQTRFVIKQDGQVGIGTTNPVAPLEVVGIAASSSRTQGIRISGPGNRITFVSSDNSTNLWNIDNDTGTLRIFRENYSSTGSGAGGVVGLSIADNGNVNIPGALTCGSGCSAGPWIRSAPNVSLSTSTDHVGIGIATPDTILQIAGGTDASVSNGSGYLVIGTVAGTNIVIDDNEIMARSNGAISDLLLQNDGGDVILANNTNTGRLGINAGLEPAGTLDVRGSTLHQPIASLSGNTSFAGLVVDNKGAGDLFTASSSGLSRFVITQNGNVRIGNSASSPNITSAPQGQFEILSNDKSALADVGNQSNYALTLWNTSSTNNQGPGLAFSNSTRQNVGAAIIHKRLGNDSMGALQFYTKSSDVFSDDPQLVLTLNAAEATASVSGNTAFAALVADNRGSGDLFTASSSGLSRFTIKQNGDVQIGTLNGGGSTASPDIQLASTINSSVTWAESTAAFVKAKYYPATNYLAFEDENATILAIDRDNNAVGIGGITDPSATLDVTAAQGQGTLAVASISGATSFAAMVVDNSGRGDLFTASSSGLNRFVIKNNGNVGIGTTLPTTLLSVGSTANMALFLNNSVSTADDPYSLGISAGADNSTRRFSVVSLNGANQQALQFGDGTTTDTIFGIGTSADTGSTWQSRLIIKQNGNIGIGTTSPLASLDIRGNLVNGGGTISVASVSGRTSFATLVADNSGVGDLFTASSSGQTRFVIKNNGNVGIGTNLPTANLYINQSHGGASALTIQSATAVDLNDPSVLRVFRQDGVELIGVSNLYSTTVVKGGNYALWNSSAFGAISVDDDAPAARFYGNSQSHRGNVLEVYDASAGNLKFAVNPLGTKSTASISANTSFAASVIDNKGSGDLFTASSSGQTRFVIKQNGSVIIGSATGSGRLKIVPLTDDTTLQDGLQVADHTQSGYAFIDYKSTGVTTPYALYGAWSDSLNAHQNVVIGAPGGSSKIGILNANPTTALDVTGVINASSNVTVNGVSVCLTSGNCSGLSQFWTMINGAISPSGTANPSVDLVLGGVSTASATFHVYGSNRAGTNPVASIAANTSFAGLVVDNKGAGDLFTASSSGLPRFVIKQDSTIQAYGFGFQSNGYGSQSRVQLSRANGTQTAPTAVIADDVTGQFVSTAYDGTNYISVADILTAVDGTPGTSDMPGRIMFRTVKDGQAGLTERMRITNAGYVGIGATTPLAILDVRGDVANPTNNATMPVASFSGNTTFAGLVVDNSGAGDLFTASSSGLNRFVITQAGNVGIGTTPGSISLNILKNGDGGIRVQTTTNGGTVASFGGEGDFIIDAPSVSAGRFVVKDNGLVGINAASPLASLDVRGNYRNNSLAGTTPIASVSSATSFAAMVVDNPGVGDIFTASSSGLPRFTINQNGNVGIGSGATIPDTALQVDAAAIAAVHLRRVGNATGGSNIQFENGATYKWEVGAAGSSSQNRFTIIDRTASGGPFRFIIDTTGNIGIGATNASFNPVATLDLRANSSSFPIASISGSTNAGFASLVVDNSGSGDLFTASSSGATRFVINQAGNVGIGTAAPSYPLQVVASSSAQSGFSGENFTTTVFYPNNSTGPFTNNSFANSTTVQGSGQNTNGTVRGFNNYTQIDANGKIGTIVGGSFDLERISGNSSANWTTATGVSSTIYLQNSPTVGTLNGINSQITLDNGVTATNVYGLKSIIDLSNPAANVTTAYGVYSKLNDDSGGASTLTTGYGMYIDTPVKSATSVRTNMYGLYINDQSPVGATLNYALYTAGGQVAFTGLSRGNALVTMNQTDSVGDILTASDSGLTRFVITQNGNVGINTGNNNSTLLSTLDVRPNAVNGGTLSVASVSGRTSFAGLVVDNSGKGDVLTASTSGRSLFTVTQNRVQIGTGSAGAYNPQLLGLDVKANAGDPTNGQAGDMYYNSGTGTFRCYTSAGWGDCGSASSSEYLRAEKNGVQDGVEVDTASDHITFNIATGSGQAISLDTTTAYAEGGSGASRGRFTLAGGRTYRLSAYVPVATWSGANGYLDYCWYNITTGTMIGSTGGIINSQYAGSQTGRGEPAEAIITTTGSTVVEVRLCSSALLTSIGAVTATQLLNPSAFIQVLSGAQTVSASEYLRAEQRTSQGPASNEVDADDHLKFDAVQAFSGSSITLDTSSAYQEATASASVGRFTLAAGKTYRMTAQIPWVNFTGSTGEIQYLWFNSTAGQLIGSTGTIFASTYTDNNRGEGAYAEAILTTTQTTTVEVRLVLASAIGGLGFTSSTPSVYPNAFIEVLSDGTKVAQFTGATAAADGAIGYVPAPLAGQQGSLLLGNGTWTAATNVAIGTTLTQPIASLSARTSFAGLVVDNTGSGDLFTASSSGLNRFVIKQNGNVGIGTTMPSEKLHVYNNADSVTTFRLENPNGGANAYAETQFVTSADRYGLGIAGPGVGSGAGNFYLWDYTAGAYRFVVDDVGKFGIGDNKDPIATLDIRATTASYPIASISGSTNAGFASLVVDNSGAGDLFTASSSGLNRFVIKQNGNVGIGTTIPSSPLEVVTTNGNGFTLSKAGTSNTTQMFLNVANQGVINSSGGLNLNYDNSQGVNVGGCSCFGFLDTTFTVFGTSAYRRATNNSNALYVANKNDTALFTIGTNPTDPVASISATSTFAGLVVDNTGRGDLFTASSSGLTRFTIKQNGNVELGSNNSLFFDGATNNQFMKWNSSFSILTTQSTGTIQLLSPSFFVKDFGGTAYIVGDGANNKIGINTGTAANTLASFDVHASPITGGTLAIASVSGRSTFASLVVDNSGSGDLFTASSSGLSRFTIQQNGNVVMNGALTINAPANASNATTSAALSIAGGNFVQTISSGSARQVSVAVDGVGGITGLNGAGRVVVQGKYAYVTANGADDALSVIDISNPDYPTQVGVLQDGAGATALNGADGIFVSGKYAYVASCGTGNSLTIIDVSNPANPVQVGVAKDGVGNVTHLACAESVYVSGKYAYVTSFSDQSLTVIDISNPASPSEVGFIKDADKATDLAGAYGLYVSGKYAYVTSQTDNALTIIDISNPTNPTQLGVIKDGVGATDLAGPHDVYVSGRYAYVAATTDDALTIIDVSNPANPTQIGVIRDDNKGGTATDLDGALGLYVSGKYAYVTGSVENSLAIIDISSPTAPIQVARVKDAENSIQLRGTNYVYVSGKYAYVTATTSNSLSIIDLPGTDTFAANIGNIWTNDITISENGMIGNSLTVANGLNVGFGGIFSNGPVAISGGTASGSAALFVAGGSGTSPTASISANTSFAALVVNNSGSGDLFTASAGGQTRFTITQAGNTILQGDTISAASNSAAVTNNGTTSFVNALGDQGSILPNASFEASTSAGLGFADGWFRSASSSSSLIVDGTTAAHGGNSAKATLGPNGQAAFYSTCIPMSAQQYTLSMQVKATVANATIRAYIDGYTSKANCAANNVSGAGFSAPVTLATTTSFAAVSGTPTALAGTQWGRVHFLIGAGNSNSIWIDAIRLTPTSSTFATGLDYAEMYPADPNNVPQPGDVVMLDASSDTTRVVPASKSADQSVIGVVSTQPGQVLDDGTVPTPKVPIALAGRIPVKVSAQNGPIAVGDYLTSSDIPGVAVKSTKPGKVIGTAMESYAQAGVGSIIVFVNLSNYDPYTFTNGGNISIFEKPGAPALNSASTYGVRMEDGSEVIKTGLFSDAVIGNLKGGSLDVQSLSIGGTNITDKLIGLEGGIASLSAGFATPLASLQTQVLSLSDRVASLEGTLAQLTASNSALFMNNPLGNFTASSGAELSLDKLNVNGPIISDSLSVLSYATINELSVTGSIHAGLLTIKGLSNGGASISTLNGDLRLQDQGFGGIDILNGKVTIDTTGNMISTGEITAKKFNVDTTDVSAASAGTGTIIAGTKSTIINTSAVTTGSIIQVTFSSDYAPATRYWIKTRTAGSSFTIQLDQPVAANAKFNWFIVN